MGDRRQVDHHSATGHSREEDRRRVHRVPARIARQLPRISAFRRAILGWFTRHGRAFPWRLAGTPLYALVVSEVLLQRTRAETVAAFFPGFLERFPDWKALADATDTELRAFLEPIGLWRRRAAALRKLGLAMTIRGGSFPQTRGEIEQLPGIGQYVASAAMMFAHGNPEPLLDVNMARVLERVFGPRKLVDIRYDPWLQRIAREVVRSQDARRFNWAILDLAAMVCTRTSPKCPTCPAVAICLYAIRRRIQRQAPSKNRS